MKIRKHVMLMMAVLMCALMLCSCKLAADEPAVPAEPTAEPAAEPAESAEPTAEGEKGQITHYAEIDIADQGVITVALYGNDAPISVANFVKLANEGFYNGLTFHRIISGFMMQGGDPNGNGTGGSGENIKGEFSANGVDNALSHTRAPCFLPRAYALSHTRGAISMARSMNYDSASSQFFIMHQDYTSLDGQYAVFGYVTDGMDIVDDICESAKPIDNNGTIPADEQPVINSITIKEA